MSAGIAEPMTRQAGLAPPLGRPAGLLMLERRVLASDTFTDIDGTVLTSHVPEVSTWVKNTTGSTNTAAPTIIGGRVVNENVATTSIYTCASPSTPNYVVSCDVVMRSDINTAVGPIGRNVAGAVTHYHIRYNALTPAWQLFKWVNNVATQLGADQIIQLTIDQAYRCELSMVGSTISMIINGVTLVTVDDTSIPNAGLAGFKMSGIATATTGIHLDNFVVRTL